jgi:hypothetical protein
MLGWLFGAKKEATTVAVEETTAVEATVEATVATETTGTTSEQTHVAETSGVAASPACDEKQEIANVIAACCETECAAATSTQKVSPCKEVACEANCECPIVEENGLCGCRKCGVVFDSVTAFVKHREACAEKYEKRNRGSLMNATSTAVATLYKKPAVANSDLYRMHQQDMEDGKTNWSMRSKPIVFDSESTNQSSKAADVDTAVSVSNDNSYENTASVVETDIKRDAEIKARRIARIAREDAQIVREHGVKKPVSAYVLFANSVRSEIRTANPTMDMCTIAKTIYDRWMALSNADRQPFIDEAVRDKMRYEEQSSTQTSSSSSQNQ